MDDKLDEVLEKYDFSVTKKSRARGAILLETDKGIKIMGETRASAGRLVWENKVKKYLKENDFSLIDLFVLNKEGTISTPDRMGTRYYVRDWYIGHECNLNDIEEVKMASSNLAILHCKFDDMTIGTETSGIAQEDIGNTFERHNRELNHICNYLKNKRYRNDFEVKLLAYFPELYGQAKDAAMQLAGVSIGRRHIIHGAYTYHNVIICDEGVATTVFDKCTYGFRLMDLYHFLRKVMEKNGWNDTYGLAVLGAYEQMCPLYDNEKEALRYLLLYPEKFWKLASHYMNTKKTWFSPKNMEKLDLLISQMDSRSKFVDEIS